MTDVDTDVLNELAECFLDDQGQVDVSVYIDEGKLGKAQAYVLGAIDKLMTEGKLEGEELQEALTKLGMSERDISRLRAGSDNQFEFPTQPPLQ